MMTLSCNNCENTFEVSEETAGIMIRYESESGEPIPTIQFGDENTIEQFL